MQCRALLRVLLAERTNHRADDITFDEETFGKPVLSGKAAGSGIHFNLSHSGSWALIAISTSGEVGVDIEGRRPQRDISGIADNFFAACEQQAIQAMATTDREAAFYRCWCRKESFAKATGLGLQLPFNRFTVNVEAQAPAKLLSVDYESLLVSQWQMHTLQVPEGYFAALTVKRASE